MQKTIGKIAIVLFCVWHMFAVAIYIIPDEADGTIPAFLKTEILPYVRPYILMTSQWQQWNIFAPDPIRRVSFYEIDVLQNGRWEAGLRIDRSTYSWRNRAKEFKIIRRTNENGDEAAKNYLTSLCRDGTFGEGTTVRMVEDFYVLPTGKELTSMDGWSHFTPIHEGKELATITCTPSL